MSERPPIIDSDGHILERQRETKERLLAENARAFYGLKSAVAAG